MVYRGFGCSKTYSFTQDIGNIWDYKFKHIWFLQSDVFLSGSQTLNLQGHACAIYNINSRFKINQKLWMQEIAQLSLKIYVIEMQRLQNSAKK